MNALDIVPLELSDANSFVELHHRHHQTVVGHKFSLGLYDGNHICGVIIVGRPVSRVLDDGWTLEVTRCCVVNEVENGCSKLYRAAWRAVIALGFRRLVTYTLPEEGGASLRGAGFRLIGKTNGGTWSCTSRPRIDKHPTQGKFRWELDKSWP